MTPGSYLVEVDNPEYVYEDTRIDINSKGKHRARKNNPVQPNQVRQKRSSVIKSPLLLPSLDTFSMPTGQIKFSGGLHLYILRLNLTLNMIFTGESAAISDQSQTTGEIQIF